MESLFIRKILNVCESLLFRNTKITLPTFLKKCKKQNFKIIRAVAERVVAFLQTLPKNLALFQALEPAFEYILQEQLAIPKEYQEFILRAEKLEFKKHIMIYEYVGYKYIYMKYPHLFVKDFSNIMERKFRLENRFEFTDLQKNLGQMWLKYGDKKNFTYYLNVDINIYYKDLEEFIYFEREELFSKRTFNSFSDMALNLLSLEIDKVNNYEIHYE